MICIVIINFSTSFMGSAILCFIISLRKQEFIKFWGCGLGLISSGYSLLCVKYDVSIFWTVIAFVFLPVVYMGLFYIIFHSPRSSFLASTARKNKNEEDNNQDSITRPMINAQSLNPYDNPNHNDGEEGSLSQLKVEKGKVKICVCNLALFHNSWGLILNFSFIYFLHRLIRGIIDLYRLQHEMTTPYTVPYLHFVFSNWIFHFYMFYFCPCY